MLAIDQTKTDQRPENLDGGIFLLALTGLRYYTPRLGRWISRDPAGMRGGLNLSAFVRNASTYRYDKLGLFSLICDKCKAGNIRYEKFVGFDTVPVVNQGTPNSVDAAVSAFMNVQIISTISAAAGVASGLGAAAVAAEIAGAAAEAGIGEGMYWGWNDQIVGVIEGIQEDSAHQQGVKIAIKIKWQKCEQVGWPSWSPLPWTQHLDWVDHDRWWITTVPILQVE